MWVASNRALYFVLSALLGLSALIGCSDGRVTPLDALELVVGGQSGGAGKSGHSGNAGRAGVGGDDPRAMNGCRGDDSSDESDADVQLDEALFADINDAVTRGQLCSSHAFLPYPQQHCEAQMRARTAAQTQGTPKPWDLSTTTGTLAFATRAGSPPEALNDLLIAAQDPRVCPFALSFTVYAIVAHADGDAGQVWVVEFQTP
jgi:hypothetical protein